MANLNHTLRDPTPLNPIAIETVVKQQSERLHGIVIATLIISLWVVSLISLMTINTTYTPIGLIAIAVLWQMFLYTGLFITAHDAMHETIYPQLPKINSLIGAICVVAYGLFSYKKLLQKHWQHHRHPASELDPDFHDGQHPHPIAWYFHFMRGYWGWHQLIGFTIIFHVAEAILQIHWHNLVLFWIVPSILSSIQLFYFGTFIPHREPANGYTNHHRTQTNPLPVFWSFLTCYHFGYHEEHHEYPHVSWWQLPTIHQAYTKMGDRTL